MDAESDLCFKDGRAGEDFFILPSSDPLGEDFLDVTSSATRSLPPLAPNSLFEFEIPLIFTPSDANPDPRGLIISFLLASLNFLGDRTDADIALPTSFSFPGEVVIVFFTSEFVCVADFLMPPPFARNACFFFFH